MAIWSLQFDLAWPPSLNASYRSYSTPKGVRVSKTKAVKDYQADVFLLARSAMVLHRRPVHRGDVELRIELYPPTAHRIDIDNRAKALLDALEGALYENDSQVVRLTFEKHSKSKRPGVRVFARFDPVPPVDIRGVHE